MEDVVFSHSRPTKTENPFVWKCMNAPAVIYQFQMWKSWSAVINQRWRFSLNFFQEPKTIVDGSNENPGSMEKSPIFRTAMNDPLLTETKRHETTTTTAIKATKCWGLYVLQPSWKEVPQFLIYKLFMQGSPNISSIKNHHLLRIQGTPQILMVDPHFPHENSHNWGGNLHSKTQSILHWFFLKNTIISLWLQC